MFLQKTIKLHKYDKMKIKKSYESILNLAVILKKISTCKLFQRKQFFILISLHIKWLMISLCQKLAPINKQKAKQVSLQTEKSKEVSF